YCRFAGTPRPLPELPYQFADFAAWQRKLLRPGERTREYWTHEFQESCFFPPPFHLRQPEGFDPTLRGPSSQFSIQLEPRFLKAIEAKARATGCTPYQAWSTALMLALRRYC